MKYQNVKINLEENMYEDIIGSAYFVFNEAATEFLITFYSEEEDLDYSIREALENPDNKLHVYDVDAFLSLVYCLTENSTDCDFEVTAGYSHIIWLFHDLSHIRYDCDEYSVAIYQGDEERAIRTSIKLCEENNIPVPWGIIAQTAEAFQERFDSPLVLSDGMGHYINYESITFKALE